MHDCWGSNTAANMHARVQKHQSAFMAGPGLHFHVRMVNAQGCFAPPVLQERLGWTLQICQSTSTGPRGWGCFSGMTEAVILTDIHMHASCS